MPVASTQEILFMIGSPYIRLPAVLNLASGRIEGFSNGSEILEGRSHVDE
ncbi:hypothetical protein Pla22_05790 [Rubripirellula amarantea]|uniref:Uncharacterized protein n=1 Tax=Rubripirellula amarantea TaxID=2527999 RepID=A0A5C5WS14_9BACT|nr:hypothetical protein Pla22_05790 [Rubripirellula amarantea]